MAASGSAARQGPRREPRSVRSALTAMVAGPAILLLVFLAAAAGLLVSWAGRRPFLSSHRDLAAGLLVGAGLVVTAAAVIRARSFAGRLGRDIRDLAVTAQQLAREGRPAATADGAARLRARTAETALAGAVIASLGQARNTAAAGDASRPDGFRQLYLSLARRNQSLLQRQLRLIDALEQKAPDPAALADLFALDHLTTRMRRHAESLAVLSGAAPGRSFRDPVPVIDVIRGAIAEIEDYTRVVTPAVADDAVLGPAAADMMHLLAELIENATLCSPSGTQVEVRSGLAAHGLAVEIDDRGLGIDPGQLEQINRMLASPPDFERADADRLGLFVAAKLAARHGARISLRPSRYGGTTAVVLLPASIIVPAGRAGGRDATPRPELAGAAAVSQRAARRLAVADRLSASAAAGYASQPDGPASGPATDHTAAPGTTPDAAGPDLHPPDLARTTAGPTTTGPAPQDAAASSPVPDLGAAGQVAAGASVTADPVADTYRGLPRRARQASLPPHLRHSLASLGPAGTQEPAAPHAPAPDAHSSANHSSGNHSPGTESPGAESPGVPWPGARSPNPPAQSAVSAGTVSPERARELASAWQSGWQRERLAEQGAGSGSAPPSQAGSDLPPSQAGSELPPSQAGSDLRPGRPKLAQPASQPGAAPMPGEEPS